VASGLSDRPRGPRQAWVYLLRCRDGTFYCGITVDLTRRVQTHNRGRGARYTQARRPVTLVWAEAAASWSEALQRERAIKGWTRARKEALAKAWNGAG
jgi:putative endonuclease